MRANLNTYVMLLVLSILLLSSCSNEEKQVEHSSDDKRIISLMPSNTEIISALGEEGSLVGVTTVDNYPESLSDDLTRLDSFELDEEAMLALNPSHIVIHESNQAAISHVVNRVAESTNADVLVVDDATNIEEIYETIDQIGQFLDREQEAKEVNEKLQNQVTEVIREYEDETIDGDVLLLVSTNPDIYVAGADTFIDDVLTSLNVRNAFSDVEGYPTVTSEELVKRDISKVVSISGEAPEVLSESLSNIAGLEDSAITNEKNQCVPDADVISRPGPRISEGLKEIAECVYE